jgi:DNA polymerase-1
MKAVIDCEANALEPWNVTKVHCVVVKDLTNNKKHYFTPDNIHEFKEFSRQLTEVWGHNFISYDAPVLNRVLGCNIPIGIIRDTLVLSRLFKYDRIGGHSLEAWGKRLGKQQKVHHEDWQNYSEAMLHRCDTDVDINCDVRKELIKESKGFSPECIDLEHQVAYILYVQKRDGFYLNVEEAEKLLAYCNQETAKLKKEMLNEFKPVVSDCGLFIPTRADRRLGYTKGSPFNRISIVEFNPASPTQIVERLKPYWKPYVFTPKKSPKVCEENLNTLSDDAPQSAHKLKQWMVLNSRAKNIQNWLDNTGPDNRVHGTVFGIGAWSQRMSHNNPNTANIPAKLDRKGNPQVLGEECRKLWCAAPGKVLVGSDADGIQLRVLAHHINNPEYTRMVVADKKTGEDIHTFNWKHTLEPYGCTAREISKTFSYAFVLGAGDEKAGLILDYTRPLDVAKKIGKQAKDAYIEKTPGLKELMIRKRRHAQQGWFRGIDGRKVPVPSDHLALTAYLQSGEAIIMKKAYTIWFEELRRRRIPFINCAIVHDEFVVECDPENAEEVGKVVSDSIVEAGLHFKLRCPLAAGYKIGENWLEVH